MNIKEIIKDKTCYIISNELKKEILSYMSNNKLLLDIHFFSINELINKIYFEYDNEAIYKVSKEFKLSFSNSKMIIDNLRYLMYSNDNSDDKIIFLKKIKQYLDNLKLLKYDSDFIDYLSSYNIITDLSPQNEFLYKINELLDHKIEFLVEDTQNNINVYKFIDSDEEIAHLANNISDLIISGVNCNNIHVINYSNDYLPYIDKIFSLYNIPYHIPSNNTLYDINEIKNLYSDYLNDIELDKTSDIATTFITIVNSLSFITDLNDKKEFLLYILKNTKKSDKKYSNCINFTSTETLYLDHNYYFFIGLNNKVYPHYKKDEDYLNDSIKEKLGYITSIKANELIREYSLNHLKSKNVTISYRENDYFNSYLKSDLIDNLKANIITKDINNDYSIDYDYLLLARELDNFYKYNNKSSLLSILLSRIDKKNYNTYDNSYNKIDKNIYFNKILNNKISVSYSSFEKFNNCSYKYYLDSILKENDDTFFTYLGNLFHHVLEKIYDENFDFDIAINEYESDYQLNEKEKVLLDNLIMDFKTQIDIILQQYNNGNFKKVIKEKQLSIKNKKSLLVDINGRIDKIMVDDEDNAYVVDYKTSNNKPTLDYLEYGLKCQLPFYFYLLSKSKEFSNLFLVGCYLQSLNFDFITTTNKDNIPLLNGYTYNDENIVEKIDNYYKEKSFIKGIKPTKNGLGTYAKTFDKESFENIIEIMENNINKMVDTIEQVDFKINPKMFKNKTTTCKNCNYKDICYKKFKDYVNVRKVNEDGLDG